MNRPVTDSWPPYRFTVGDYHQMVKTGILSPDDQVELLDGEVVRMSPIGPLHASAVAELTEWLMQTLGQRAKVRSEIPITLDDHSEPQPDICIVRRRKDRHRGGHPRPDEVFFLIEVADATLAVDRRLKVPLYAKSAIPEVWLVNLVHQKIEVYREPGTEGYQQREEYRFDQPVSPLAFTDLQVTLCDVLF